MDGRDVLTVLQLPAYTVLKVEAAEHDYHITAEPVESNRICPQCASVNAVGFGRREQLVKDLPLHGREDG